MFVHIDNIPRDYSWGSLTGIAEFRGTQPSGKPEAELWLGAHPGSPARLVSGAAAGGIDDLATDDLAEWIAAHPQEALTGGERLPFLLKILAAGSPLSLQAHPTSEQAVAGFTKEEAAGVPLTAAHRNYKDRFHKPELIVAVSETFDALSGFRPLSEIEGVIAVLRKAAGASDYKAAVGPPGDYRPAGATADYRAAVDLLAHHLLGEAGSIDQNRLADTVGWLLSGGVGVPSVIAAVTSLSASGAARASVYAASFETVSELAAVYPGDPGVVISLLLNRVRLARGEALYLAAGNIHAYLFGVGIELMAASDNVLRGGLTSKHIDVIELMRVLDFNSAPPPRLIPEEAQGIQTFRPGVTDFLLHRIMPSTAPDGTATISIHGPAIVLAEHAQIKLVGTQGETTLERGAAAYITPAERTVTVTGRGVAWIATIG